MGQSAISYEIATKTGQWDIRMKKEFVPFEASINSVFNFCRYHKYELKVYKEYMDQHELEYLHLYYEDLFSDSTLSRVSEYLELEGFAKNYSFQSTKLNSLERYNKITNISKIREILLEYDMGDLFSNV